MIAMDFDGVTHSAETLPTIDEEDLHEEQAYTSHQLLCAKEFVFVLLVFPIY